MFQKTRKAMAGNETATTILSREKQLYLSLTLHSIFYKPNPRSNYQNLHSFQISITLIFEKLIEKCRLSLEFAHPPSTPPATNSKRSLMLNLGNPERYDPTVDPLLWSVDLRPVARCLRRRRWNGNRLADAWIPPLANLQMWASVLQIHSRFSSEFIFCIQSLHFLFGCWENWEWNLESMLWILGRNLLWIWNDGMFDKAKCFFF